MDIVEVEGLEKVYKGGITALSGLTFQVREGEIFGFLGPNGAGKSTTMKILTTLALPTGGQARVCGHDVVREPEAVRRRIGYVAQDVGVDELCTARENLTLQGHLYHLPAAEVCRRTGELLELMGLAAEADRIVRTYSGGMRKRLDIATGLVHRPSLLFLDEPTVGLDPQNRAHLWDYIRRLNREHGVTIFLTTHYLEEADQLCDRIAIIDHGGIVAEGTPNQLKDEVRGDGLSVQVAPGVASLALEAVAGLSFVRDSRVGAHGEVLLWVERGAEAVPVVIRELESRGVRVASVSVSRPSLDDVFLKHTGRSIRDDSGEASTKADRARAAGRRS